jgi:ribonuclease HI
MSTERDPTQEDSTQLQSRDRSRHARARHRAHPESPFPSSAPLESALDPESKQSPQAPNQTSAQLYSTAVHLLNTHSINHKQLLTAIHLFQTAQRRYLQEARTRIRCPQLDTSGIAVQPEEEYHFYLHGTNGDTKDRRTSGISGILFNSSNTSILHFAYRIDNQLPNVPEYVALMIALTYIQRLRIERVVIYCDHKLLIQQITQQWSVRSPQLRAYYNHCSKLWCTATNNGSIIEFLHIARRENGAAQQLASSIVATDDITHILDNKDPIFLWQCDMAIAETQLRIAYQSLQRSQYREIPQHFVEAIARLTVTLNASDRAYAIAVQTENSTASTLSSELSSWISVSLLTARGTLLELESRRVRLEKKIQSMLLERDRIRSEMGERWHTKKSRPSVHPTTTLRLKLIAEVNTIIEVQTSIGSYQVVLDSLGERIRGRS